jgi:hypothetical protein
VPKIVNPLAGILLEIADFEITLNAEARYRLCGPIAGHPQKWPGNARQRPRLFSNASIARGSIPELPGDSMKVSDSFLASSASEATVHGTVAEAQEHEHDYVDSLP